MKNVLLTGTNSSKINVALYSIKKEFDCKIVGAAAKNEALGEFLCDSFYMISINNENEYIKSILDICEKEDIDMIVPGTTRERLMLMSHIETFSSKDIKILSSSKESIEKANNKIDFFEICKEIDIPLAEYYIVSDFKTLREKAEELGYPKKKVIVKPVIAAGSKGFRILHEDIDFKKAFYEKRGDGYEMTIDGLYSILGDDFPDLILSEYLPGDEFTVDCLRHNDDFVAITRKRMEVNMGLTSKGKIEKNDEIIEYCKKLAEKIDLTTVFGFQFKMDSEGKPKILECNPRIQGTMIMSTLCGANIISESMRILNGEKRKDFNIDWNMKFYRFWSGVSFGEKTQIVNL